MARNRGITDLPLQIYTNAMADAVPDNQITSIMHVLSLTNRELHGLFKMEVNKRFHKALWQAVIDDDCEAVREIFMVRPKLLFELLIEKSKSFIIESKYTYQKFNLEDENILTVAVKRRQAEMIKVLLSCFAKFEKIDVVRKEIADALAKWPVYEIQDDEIVIPEKDVRDVNLLIKLLLDALKAETFSDGSDGKVSEKTESALSSFVNKLLPKKVVKLDDYLDMELHVLDFWKNINNRASAFEEKEERQLFIYVMKCMQSLLLLQTAKSVYAKEYFNTRWKEFIKTNEEVNRKKEEIFDKIMNGEVFYRPHRDSLDCLGSVFYQMTDQKELPQFQKLMNFWGNAPWDLLDKKILEKQKAIEELKRKWQYRPQTGSPDSINVDQRNSLLCRK